jgi:hypothetical protein
MRALVISARDNVATALDDLEAGAMVEVGEQPVAVAERIPRGHKVALRPIAAGEPVVKYGSPIGTATVDIPVGAHVHVHNVASSRGRGDLAARARADARIGEPRIAEPPDAVGDRESETVT